MIKFPLGGAGGFPYDMVDSPELVGYRRLKISSQSSLNSANIKGLLYSISVGESENLTIASGAYVGFNLQFASDVIVHKIIANTDLLINVYDSYVSGTPDGIYNAVILNGCLEDFSPSSLQIFTGATSNGNLLDFCKEVLPTTLLFCDDNTPSVLLKNIGATTQTLQLAVIFEEIGPRNPSFGLTPTTQLEPDTEMSDYG